MDVSVQGENLIFLISQPRAGSTLLQRILGSHPDIHTVSEPWLLLSSVYALREKGHWAEYDASMACRAMREFLRTLPHGEGDYIEGTRRMYAYLYERALSESAKKYFLDKTPRYYFIIPELRSLFPKAHFIILLRNPLAVLCSMLNSWVRGVWFLLGEHKHDLLTAPQRLLAGIESLGEQSIVVHFEKLVSEPESEVQGICAKLGVEFASRMIDYGRSDSSSWRYGDQIEIDHYTRPVPQNAEKWIQSLEGPQVWRLARYYLRFLGRETVTQMGYSCEELDEILDNYKPNPMRIWLTYPLRLLLNGLRWTERLYTWDRRVIWLTLLLRQQGIGATMKMVAHKLAKPQGGSEESLSVSDAIS
jgi:hypothetical protein